jgi:hypothetical protein
MVIVTPNRERQHQEKRRQQEQAQEGCGAVEDL